jgi:hypothetical protein
MASEFSEQVQMGDFNEEDLVASMKVFTRKPLPVPLMNTADSPSIYSVSPASFHKA